MERSSSKFRWPRKLLILKGLSKKFNLDESTIKNWEMKKK